MKLKKPFLYNILFAGIICLLILVIRQQGLLHGFEQNSLDLLFQLRGSAPANQHIIIVEITDNDITQIGRWPWKRTWEAALARALTDLGAKYIYFDIIFSESSSDEDDALFTEAIKQSKNVYLPFALQAPAFDIATAFLPIKTFKEHIKGTGATNIFPDDDGTIRRIPLVFQDAGNTYPHIALKIGLDYLGLELKKISPHYLIAENPHRSLRIPVVDDNYSALVNWSGKWQYTFRHLSVLDILAKYKDLLDNKLPPSVRKDFKDSICLVGLTAVGLYDIKPIPLQPEYPGIGIVATTIGNIIENKFLFPVPAFLNILALIFLTLLPAFLIRGDQPLKENLLLIIIAIGYFVGNYFLFKAGWLMDYATVLLGFGLSTAIIGIYNFVRIAVERQNFFKMSVTDGLTGLYNIRYFKLLLETELVLAKHDPTKKFAIVMSDVDHFKKFNDTYGHQIGDLVLKEVSAVLKTSTRSSDLVARYGGEEMIVLLRGVGIKEALVVADKLRKNIEAHTIKDEKNTYQVTVSLGVSIFRQNDTVDSVIKRADDGLYKSKEGGRNCASTVEALE